MPVLDSTERAVPRSALRHRPIRADADEQEERSSASAGITPCSPARFTSAPQKHGRRPGGERVEAWRGGWR
jgi:hypothetical protein